MAYKLSDNSIKVLKELYKGQEYKKITSKEEVEELLFGLSFIIIGGKIAKNDDDLNAKEFLENLKECGEEIKNNLDDLDLEYLNNELSQ